MGQVRPLSLQGTGRNTLTFKKYIFYLDGNGLHWNCQFFVFSFSKYKCYFRIQEAIEDEIFLGKLDPTYSKKMNGNSLEKHFQLINSISLCLPSLEVGKMFFHNFEILGFRKRITWSGLSKFSTTLGRAGERSQTEKLEIVAFFFFFHYLI